MVFECVKAMSGVLKLSNIPLFCKIRIPEGHDMSIATKAFCDGLVENGAELICLHARLRGSSKLRRCGPANLELVAEIANHLLSREVPVISNGNVCNRKDAIDSLSKAHPAAGIMSAEVYNSYD